MLFDGSVGADISNDCLPLRWRDGYNLPSHVIVGHVIVGQVSI